MAKLLVLFLSYLHLLKTQTVILCEEDNFTCVEGKHQCIFSIMRPPENATELSEFCAHSGFLMKTVKNRWRKLGCEGWDYVGLPKLLENKRDCNPNKQFYNDYCNPETSSTCRFCINHENLKLCKPISLVTNPPEPESNSTVEDAEAPKAKESFFDTFSNSVSDDPFLLISIILPILVVVIIILVCVIVRLRKIAKARKKLKKSVKPNKKKKKNMVSSAKSLVLSETESSTIRSAMASGRSSFRTPSTLLPSSPPKKVRLDGSPSAENPMDNSVLRSDFSVKSPPKQKAAPNCKKTKSDNKKKNNKKKKSKKEDKDDITSISTVSQR